MYAKTDNEDLIRDMSSRAIINVNDKRKEEFRLQREKEQRISNLENKLYSLEDNLNEIRNLLSVLINK